MGFVLTAVQRAETLPGLRPLTTIKPVVRFTGALRCSLVAECARFAFNELRPRPVVAQYTLRKSRRSIMIRHHKEDLSILDELFAQDEYVLPTHVNDVLRSFRNPRVLDLGANIGLFALWLLERHSGATIVGYEADPMNASVHEQVIALNAVEGSWDLRRKFAATAPSVVSFDARSGASSTALVGDDPPHGQRIDVEAEDVFGELERADFAKIDIEGGEWAILNDARLSQLATPALVVEYHPFGPGSPDTCQLGHDPGIEAEKRLHDAGYMTLRKPKKHPRGFGLIWAWRPAPVRALGGR
jgi:FkbM family methyltransferase